MPRTEEPAPFQRNALAPSLIAAAILFAAPLLFGFGWGSVVLFGATILGVIIGWFALQAKQWWWTIVFVVIAIVWNPIFPFAFEGIVWTVAQSAAAIAFLVAGVRIKTPVA